MYVCTKRGTREVCSDFSCLFFRGKISKMGVSLLGCFGDCEIIPRQIIIIITSSTIIIISTIIISKILQLVQGYALRISYLYLPT